MVEEAMAMVKIAEPAKAASAATKCLQNAFRSKQASSGYPPAQMVEVELEPWWKRPWQWSRLPSRPRRRVPLQSACKTRSDLNRLHQGIRRHRWWKWNLSHGGRGHGNGQDCRAGQGGECRYKVLAKRVQI